MNAARTLITATALISAVVSATSIASPARGADPWADRVVEYIPGSGLDMDFVTGGSMDDPLVALGEPTRYTSDPQNFGGAVTPFQTPFRATEIVSIGNGGSLTVAFDEPVTDDPLNPFGIDLLIFGNAFYSLDFAKGLATGAVAAEAGVIEVSADGTNYVPILGPAPDGAFPTLGYLDVAEPFPGSAGTAPSDFTRPVDPAFNPAGRNIAQIIAGYNGSGGGVGIDLAGTGLAAITHVRISNPRTGGSITPEIDAFADVAPVPEPPALAIALIAIIFLGKSVTVDTVKSVRC